MAILGVSILAALFALFPLTDTDIWWHLACGREWVVTWSPVREPVLNIHHYFQQLVYGIYSLGGAPLLVAFKGLLWGTVFGLFLRNSTKDWKFALLFSAPFLFIFRYQLEIRPVIFTHLFLGILWNGIPWMGGRKEFSREWWISVVGLFGLQWIWCGFQGLYILGPILVGLMFFKKGFSKSRLIILMLLLMVPLMRPQGLQTLLYPFELLNRLLGISPSATVFAKSIAENRSPLTLMMEGENLFQSILMVILALESILYVICQKKFFKEKSFKHFWLILVALLTLTAERNFILFLPVFLAVHLEDLSPKISSIKVLQKNSLYLCALVLLGTLGLWVKSLAPYDRSLIAYQRVPVSAAEWMKSNPHPGRLFNDDRAGGYLAFVNPTDSTYIDGRFILKTADFFEQYLNFAEDPEAFARYATQNQIDRVVLPIRYYARWEKLINALSADHSWKIAYKDDYYCVFDSSAF